MRLEVFRYCRHYKIRAILINNTIYNDTGIAVKLNIDWENLRDIFLQFGAYKPDNIKSQFYLAFENKDDAQKCKEYLESLLVMNELS